MIDCLPCPETSASGYFDVNPEHETFPTKEECRQAILIWKREVMRLIGADRNNNELSL
jgi:hypothetical protein